MSVYDESDIYRDVSLAVAPSLCTVLRRGRRSSLLCSLTVLLELPIFVVYIGQDVRIGRESRGRGDLPSGQT
jgi:hypothetical protein